ncbi:MAG: signal peptidase I [Lachnospiraceae bacterium]|nr:signal peptidase I [Lachnospiraceae bacterium]MBQ8547750.1 signal peptidase I [Lachnospiraceae bacterium]MBQ8845756.1 signal peptidase I [Lachnospiraceae bacterium]
MKKKAIVETVIFLAVSALLLFGVPRFLMERVIVDGPSMESTLQNGDNILVEKVSRYFGALDRFDIVVFYPDEEAKKNNGRYYIKRIIGLPGETVRIDGDVIFINGEPLAESFGFTKMGAPGIAKDGVTLGEDEFFVLGDNRIISKDSRSEAVGVVPLSRIGGKMILRIFPFGKFGTVN